MIKHIPLLLCLTASLALAQSTIDTDPVTLSEDAIQNVDTNGFDETNKNAKITEESWLKKHNRYIFVIVLGVLFLAVLIWYISRSICGMRRKLANDNQNQMNILQNARGFPENVPIDGDGFHKMSEYSNTSTHTQPQTNIQPQTQASYSHRY